MVQQWSVNEPFLATQGKLLEGPIYNDLRQECLFIDIDDHKVYTFNPAQGPDSLKSFTSQETLGVAAHVKGSSTKQVVAARRGFGIIDSRTGAVEYIKGASDLDHEVPEVKDKLRFNDGAVDCKGRFWAGNMWDSNFGKAPRGDYGCMYRLDPDFTLHHIFDKVGTPNGIGWNAASTVMYWTDSVEGIIYAYDFDPEAGTVSNRRVFWERISAGYSEEVDPDGLVIDEGDCVWTALWRGSKMLRLSPEGKLIGEVTLPTAYITCAIFVGTDLLVTTARNPMVEEAGIKRGGDVYLVPVGVRGQEKYEFTLPESLSNGHVV